MGGKVKGSYVHVRLQKLSWFRNSREDKSNAEGKQEENWKWGEGREGGMMGMQGSS